MCQEENTDGRKFCSLLVGSRMASLGTSGSGSVPTVPGEFEVFRVPEGTVPGKQREVVLHGLINLKLYLLLVCLMGAHTSLCMCGG